ncbi:MAG TPA: hypothetical protein VJ819_12580 [Nocardioidaceae bacterium]|nr:hypothetical protein [Nocardioidaceae bacterium]
MQRTAIALTAGFIGVSIALGTAAPAMAKAPPPSWENERVLDCGGETVLTFLGPPGIGTPFNVVDSEDVIIPVLIQVVFPDGTGPITTLDLPGFDRNSVDTVQCTYTDPAGLLVTLTGIRT